MRTDNYTPPTAEFLEIALEGSAMLAQSGYDEKHNTEKLGWDDSIDF